VNSVVPRDVVSIGEVARDLVIDNFSRDCLTLAKDDAEELMRRPLRMMKAVREGDIAVRYSAVATSVVDYGTITIYATIGLLILIILFKLLQ
jgi:hypothetical protein